MRTSRGAGRGIADASSPSLTTAGSDADLASVASSAVGRSVALESCAATEAVADAANHAVVTVVARIARQRPFFATLRARPRRRPDAP